MLPQQHARIHDQIQAGREVQAAQSIVIFNVRFTADGRPVHPFHSRTMFAPQSLLEPPLDYSSVVLVRKPNDGCRPIADLLLVTARSLILASHFLSDSNVSSCPSCW